jgi:signal transduction histidine kinase
VFIRVRGFPAIVTLLPFQATAYRLFSRLRTPTTPGEVRRIERWLASARVFLAISALVAIWMDPSEMGYSPWAYWLLGLYIVHGVVVMLLVRIRKQSTPSFRLLVHGADIVWPVLVTLFATGQGSPFFLFFVFVLGASAYRWGLRETFGTSVATVSLLWAESFAVRHGATVFADHVLAHYRLAPLAVNVSQFEPKRLFMLSAYLLVMGLLLGYLAEQQKRLRSERAIIALILGRARVEVGLTGTLQEILAELLSMYGARRALIASQETNKYRVFVGDVHLTESGSAQLHWLESSPLDRETYLYESDADVSLAIRKSNQYQCLSLDRDGVRLRSSSPQPLAPVAGLYPFLSLVAVSFLFGQEWWGRIFLLDPVLGGDREEELRFLQELVRQVGPAVYNVYLLRRLRQRAGAVERARVARELHDGAVQSLIAMEMQVDVLRRQPQASPLASELVRIQGLLREEVLKLRELMQQMKSLDVDASTFLRFLRDTVERFQRETGIGARFVSELDEIEMSQRVCRELARIVQEGLVNVRKHSAAKHVLVCLTETETHWQLTMEDNGCGFPFSGRFSQADLEKMGKGPMVIRERVRLIDGELTIESSPSRGARLEVSVPRH